MNRRQFLKSLLSGVAGSTLANIDVDRLFWVPGEKTIFLPSAAQTKFFASDKLMTLHGIPYHACDGATGQWLGISRVMGIHEEVLQMIKLLEEDKRGPS